MNVIDVLAIAPYWISLFLPDESQATDNVADYDYLLEEREDNNTSDVNNEEDSTFGSVSRIMQV